MCIAIQINYIIGRKLQYNYNYMLQYILAYGQEGARARRWWPLWNQKMAAKNLHNKAPSEG